MESLRFEMLIEYTFLRCQLLPYLKSLASEIIKSLFLNREEDQKLTLSNLEKNKRNQKKMSQLKNNVI